ncbi:unnamed protein product [Scytosiphon promiscuus]
MSSSSSGRLPPPADLHPDIVVKYLERLGVTPETTRAIRDQVERKKQQDKARLAAAAAAAAEGDSAPGDGSAARKSGGTENVRSFVQRQGMDAGVSDGDNVMAWGILEGNPEKVEQAYRGLSGFVSSSWELYRPELEAVTFPVFVHCYLTLVMFDHGTKARSLMRAWGGEHEARYKEEITLLKMVTAKEHAQASGYCQLVLTHKFRVKICWATSKLLNAFLVNKGLLLVMHILNTRVKFILEERSPLPFVVRCGPDDAFPAALRPRSPPNADQQEDSAAAGASDESLKWAAAPPMEVALLKQTERNVSFPLKPPPQPEPASNWPYLRLTLRPLDARDLKDTLSTPEGGARPFLANPLSPHVVMLTFYNALDTLCCLKPTRDGMQVAAGFTDRMVRAWRTAPNAPHPPAADEASAAGGRHREICGALEAGVRDLVVAGRAFLALGGRGRWRAAVGYGEGEGREFRGPRPLRWTLWPGVGRGFWARRVLLRNRRGRPNGLPLEHGLRVTAKDFRRSPEGRALCRVPPQRQLRGDR